MNTYDQGYAVAGQSYSFGTGGEGFLIEFDANMNEEAASRRVHCAGYN